MKLQTESDTETMTTSTEISKDQARTSLKNTIETDSSSSNDQGSDEDSGLFLNASDASLDKQHDDDDDDDFEIDGKNWRYFLPVSFNKFSEKELSDYREKLLKDVDALPIEEQRDWAMQKIRESMGDDTLPESVIEIYAGEIVDGDDGAELEEKPDWLDVEKFRRGQKVVRDFRYGFNYSQLISLLMPFSFEDGLKPLILTEKSSTPYTAFKRYLSTGVRVHSWFTSDPWAKDSRAYKEIKNVRRMHAMARKKIDSLSIEEYEKKCKITEPYCPTLDIIRQDFKATCQAPKSGQCPYFVLSKFPQLRGKKLSQGEMSATLFAFVSLPILHPKFFGIHASDEDLEAFCHAWRAIGYLLGIRDEFNACRGSLEDVRERSRNFIEYWVKPNFRVVNPEWEHMMRCVVEGLDYYFPGATYETCLLDLAEIFNLHMPRLQESITYSAWIKHKLLRSFFNHGSKVSALRAALNYRLGQSVEKAVNFDEKTLEKLKEKSKKTLEKGKS